MFHSFYVVQGKFHASLTCVSLSLPTIHNVHKALRGRNGFSKADLNIIAFDIDDEVTKKEVVHKYHRADKHPAKVCVWGGMKETE